MKTPTDEALALLELVVVAICREPDQLRMMVDRTPGAIVVSFNGNAADTRRLVGHGGIMIRTLASLFKLLMSKADRSVAARINRMEPNAKPEANLTKRNPRPFRPSEFESLLRRLAEFVFECPVHVTSRAADDHGAHTFLARVDQEEIPDDTAETFGRCIMELFTAAGKNHGRPVYVQLCASHDRAAALRAGAASGSGPAAR